MNEGYSLSDIGAVANGSGMFGGNSSWVLIILFALIFGWGGNGFGRCTDFGQYATATSQTEILLGQQFQNLDNKIDRIGNGIADATFALNNSVKDGNSMVAGRVVDEGRAIQSQIADCCCTTQRNIDSVRFDMSNYTASIRENDNANTQKILDVLAQNKIETLQGRINQLELQQAMCGVVRYPNGMTYNAGTSPFCACNNGCCM